VGLTHSFLFFGGIGFWGEIRKDPPEGGGVIAQTGLGSNARLHAKTQQRFTESY